MTKQLRISDDLSLPIDAATQTFAFIARKGAGKTYAAGKLAECFLDAKIQVVILDSVGNWYGLRLLADGKSPGYDIPVIGGLRGDIPLEATGGHLIADIITDSGRSLIIDISQFNKSDRQRFATAFAQQLWKSKKAEKHPTPLHLIIEESQLIIPETVRGDVATMVGIYEEIIRLGRNYGIGVSMITQRPQSVNKEVLNQTECLFALQVNGKHERVALRDWITYHGAEKSLVDELPALSVGTAYVWSPQWLGILQKVRVGKKKTFDASATPKVGSHQVRRDLKPLNLDDLKTRMAETIEKAKAENPKELQKRIKELERQLARPPAATASPNGTELKALTQTIKQEQANASALRKALQEAMKFIVNINAKEFFAEAGQPIDEAAITSALTGAVSQITKLIERKLDVRNREVDAARKEGQRIISRLQKLLDDESIEVDVTVKHNAPFTVEASAPQKPPITRRPSQLPPGNGTVSASRQRILNALAWLKSIGISPVVKKQVALMAEQSPTSGGFFNNLGALRSAGLIDYPSPGFIALTDAGRAVAEVADIPTSSEELQSQVCSMVTNSQASILRAAIAVHPDSIQKSELAEKVGQSPTSGGYFNNLGRLRSLGLIDYPQSGYVVASSVLFL